jgi:hypothetical protein
VCLKVTIVASPCHGTMAALGVEFVEGEEIISTSPPSNYLVIIGDGLLAAE